MFDDSLVREAFFPVSEYSKRQIVAAGKILREQIRTEDVSDARLVDLINKNGIDVFEAFRIAHNWRDSHMRPMLAVRNQLSAKLRTLNRESVSAARLKRMHSIRRKMQTRPITLYQMQDIAGCRAVVESCGVVSEMAKFYEREQQKHIIVNVDDYITNPKADGYRSHHVILKFQGEGEAAAYNRQTVEVQLRTKAQHSWATAVEAIGLIKHENIKGGGGTAEWRRFFELMASEIAYDEDLPPCPSAPDERNLIREELREVSGSLGAVSMLETLNHSFGGFEKFGNRVARYFLLQFDYKTQKLSIEPFFEFSAGSERYIEAEERQTDRNSVLVEVNGIAELKAAFPNYFLDVQAFTERLQAAIAPKTVSRNPEVRQKAEANWSQAWINDWQNWRQKRRGD